MCSASITAVGRYVAAIGQVARSALSDVIVIEHELKAMRRLFHPLNGSVAALTRL